MSLVGRHQPLPPGMEEDEESVVRPYALTRGRTRAGSGGTLPMEALVQGLTTPTVSHTPEQRRILTLCTEQFQSVAELGAHLGLPVGVVRVVLGDLVDSRHVRVHGLTQSEDVTASIPLSVLESVLDGISAL